MKFHYQYVSQNSVRIELIPEDPKEKKLIEEIRGWDREDLQLRQSIRMTNETKLLTNVKIKMSKMVL